MRKAKIKAGQVWRHKGDNYHVTIADLPTGAPKGSVAHEAHGGVKLHHEADFRSKFEPLDSKLS